jgi:hypothetical protein
MSTLHAGNRKGYLLHVYSAGSGKGIHPSHSHCMRWKWIHPNAHTAFGGKENTLLAVRWITLTSTLLTVERDKIQPLVHNAGVGRDTFLLLTII